MQVSYKSLLVFDRITVRTITTNTTTVTLGSFLHLKINNHYQHTVQMEEAVWLVSVKNWRVPRIWWFLGLISLILACFCFYFWSYLYKPILCKQNPVHTARIVKMLTHEFYFCRGDWGLGLLTKNKKLHWTFMQYNPFSG